jgi:hypothetical protein
MLLVCYENTYKLIAYKTLAQRLQTGEVPFWRDGHHKQSAKFAGHVEPGRHSIGVLG